ncbi:MAG: DNA polymerase I [Patescibacteria group bacterium]
MKMKKLIIIDGNALIHRSFHALPPSLKTKDGLLVNAVYGFTSFLLKALLEFKPEYVVLTLDKKGPTFRHEAYSDYKATRTKAPDELYEQIPLVKEVADSLNISIFELSGYEADDLIGTICAQLKDEKNLLKIIITGDMDTLQLVDQRTEVYTMSRGLNDTVIYNEAKVFERYELKPDQIIDYKALRGDPSDNIPGVKGIGEKTATELLKEFKDLDKLYQAVREKNPKIPLRILERLQENKPEAFLSRELATINLQAPINFKLENINFSNFNLDEVVSLFKRLEFKSLLNKVKELRDHIKPKEQGNQDGEAKFQRNSQKLKYHLIDSDKEFHNFLKKLKTTKAFAFDTETSGLDPLIAGLLGISFSWQAGEGYFLSLRTPEKKINTAGKKDLFSYQATDQKTQDLHPWLKALAPIFKDKEIEKYGHNLKFDLRVLQAQGLEINGLSFDTMIASYLLNPENRQHGLDSLSFSELSWEKISKENLLGKGKEKISWPEVPPAKMALYAVEDADCTARLTKIFKKKLKTAKLENLFNKIELPLVTVLADMENWGIKVDKNFLKVLDKKLSRNLAELEKKIHEVAGQKFNINSTKQLKEILFEKLDIPTDNVKRTKTGFSTAEDELNKLWELHPIIPLLKDYRELSKLLSTYIKALPNLINPITGRIHTNYNQTVAATGRLSSNDPNLQNIPTKTEIGRQVRAAFVADQGYKLVSFDYSQIELRIVADIANDPTLIQAFRDNKDIHTITAAAINGVGLEEVTKKMRNEAKAVNFGIIYGQGPHGLSQGAGIPYFKAKEFIDKYFASYPKIKKLMDRTIELARRDGFVSTLFGRQRPLSDINSQIVMARKAAERMAINTPIQGTAADLIKMAMIKIHEMIKDKPEEIKLLLQVHDELIFEIRQDKIGFYAPKIKKAMEEVIKLKVPIIAEYSQGDNWGELK